MEVVRELHRDLARKYQLPKLKIEQLWRSFDDNHRAQAFKAGQVAVMKNSTDQSLGNVYKIIPELNLHGIANSCSDYLLNLLKYRATKSLVEQYCEGMNGGPGDHLFILNSIRNNNLRHVNPFKYRFTLFLEESDFGKSYKAADTRAYRTTMAGLATAVNDGLCVPQSTGELILERLIQTLQSLNILFEDIYDASSTKNTKKNQEEIQ
jgi:hypothetical protein